MAERYDVIVIGVGGMGSAAAYHLARRGKSVLGLEQFEIPNEMGSSHGLSRIIRLAYFEDPAYVPLLRRAYELWRALETEYEPLLRITGSLEISLGGTELVGQSMRSCDMHGIPYELLDERQVARRYPAFKLPIDARALFQPDGGFLSPEEGVQAHERLARENGAVVRTRERVQSWKAAEDGVRVITDWGTYDADKLVICAGSWVSTLVPELKDLAVPERQVMTWLQPRRPEHFWGDRFPVFIMETTDGHFYGIPLGTLWGYPPRQGLKIARHHHRGEAVSVWAVDRAVHSQDIQLSLDFVKEYLPDAQGPVLAAKVCLYTNSPDGNFIVDRHPQHDNVLIAAGFSGHGFKFCPVMGEILADLATDGSTQHDISLFRLDRFKESSLRTA